MGKLTAKDFKKIAIILKDAEQTHCLRMKDKWGNNLLVNNYNKWDVLNPLCDYLATTNAQFKRDEFLKACGCGVEEMETVTLKIQIPKSYFKSDLGGLLNDRGYLFEEVEDE